MNRSQNARRQKTFIRHPDYKIRFRSSDEKFYYNILKNVFNEVYVNCRVKENYDFEIDFYIKDLDLYLDMHLHFSHGSEPFTKSDEQLSILDSLGNSDRDQMIISTWTKRDVDRLETSRELNLNYLAIYNDDQFFDWLKNLKIRGEV